MGIVKGLLKLTGSAALAVTGTASTILKGMSETAGVDIGVEIFGAAKDASFNGIRNIWGMDAPEEEELSEEEEISREKIRLKAQALRCKDMAQKATDENMRSKFMARYEELMDQANEM